MSAMAGAPFVTDDPEPVAEAAFGLAAESKQPRQHHTEPGRLRFLQLSSAAITHELKGLGKSLLSLKALSPD